MATRNWCVPGPRRFEGRSSWAAPCTLGGSDPALSPRHRFAHRLLGGDTAGAERAYLDYHRNDLPLCYWRSQSRLEVDFVIGDRIAIEVEAKARIARRDHSGLRALAEELPLERKIVVCTEPRRRRDEDVEVLPVEDFLSALWDGKIV